MQLALLPFGEQALRHFMFLERPEGMDLDDAGGLAALGAAAPVMNPRDIVPPGQDFATVGHPYRSIEAGFRHLCERYGENWLFTGPRQAEATQQRCACTMHAHGWAAPAVFRVQGLGHGPGMLGARVGA